MLSPARAGLRFYAPTAATTLSPFALSFTPVAARTQGVAGPALQGDYVGTACESRTAAAAWATVAAACGHPCLAQQQ